MKTRIGVASASALAAAILVAGCAPQKGQAEKAIADVDAAVQAAGPEVQHYIPDQLAEVRTKLDTLKASMKESDYQSVVANSPAVLAAAKGLPAAAEAKKKESLIEAASQWSALSSTLPREMASIDHRLVALERTHHLPRGLDHKQLESAQRSFEAAKGNWRKAAAAFQSGKVAEAVAKAKAVEGEAAAMMSELQMKEARATHS